MNYKDKTKLLDKRLELNERILELSLGLAGLAIASPMLFDQRVKQIEQLKAELDAIPVPYPEPVGRPKVAPNPKSKVVKITLAEEDWEDIEGFVKTGSSYSEYFRELYLSNKDRLPENDR